MPQVQTVNAPDDVLAVVGRRLLELTAEAFAAEIAAQRSTLPCLTGIDMKAALDEWEQQLRTGFDELIAGIQHI